MFYLLRVGFGRSDGPVLSDGRRGWGGSGDDGVELSRTAPQGLPFVSPITAHLRCIGICLRRLMVGGHSMRATRVGTCLGAVLGPPQCHSYKDIQEIPSSLSDLNLTHTNTHTNIQY